MANRLTVLLPNFNHAAYLPQALDSILALEEYLHELVIRDDASTDDSWAILARYAARHPVIRLTRNSDNLGAMGNFKALLADARGEYVMIHAADDFWLVDAMRELLRAMRDDNDSTVGMYCGRNRYRIEATGHEYSRPSAMPEGLWTAGSVARFKRRIPWGAAGTILRTDLYRDLFDRLRPTGCYYDCFMELIVAQRHPVWFLDRETACTRCLSTNFCRVSRTPRMRAEAFAFFIRLIRDEYPDLYKAMRVANQFADYEGMGRFLLGHPSIWDRHTPWMLARLLPHAIYRQLRYGVLSRIAPERLKRLYRALSNRP